MLRLPLVDVGADRLDPRPVGRRAFAFVAAAPDHLRVAKASVRGELLRGARLADAGLADKHHQPSATGKGVLEACAQFVHLLVAADKDAAGQSVQGVGVGLGGRGSGARRRVDDRLECLRDRGRTLWAFAWVLGQRAHDERFERARHLRVVPGRRDGSGVDVLRDDRHGIVPEERRAAGHHLVGDAAKRIEVGASVGRSSQSLFWRHVGDSPDHHSFHS